MIHFPKSQNDNAPGWDKYDKTDKFVIGAEYLTQQWKDFSLNSISDSLRNSFDIRLGAEFIPNANRIDAIQVLLQSVGTSCNIQIDVILDARIVLLILES